MAAAVPPMGYVGFSQMTPASRAALMPGMSQNRSSTRRKSTRSARKTSSRTGARRSRKSNSRKLKFGSPAWRKKYAAKAKRNAAKARRRK